MRIIRGRGEGETDDLRDSWAPSRDLSVCHGRAGKAMVRTSPRLQQAAILTEETELRRREGDVAMESAAAGGDCADVPVGRVTHEQNVKNLTRI